jgi:hypothetical protein
MSTETLKINELAKKSKEFVANQQAEILPGYSTTFYGQEGRSYIVALTDIDGDYPATVSVFDMDYGTLISTVTLEPFTAKSVLVEMGKGNGVRVYNQSNQPTAGRPTVNASLYHA